MIWAESAWPCFFSKEPESQTSYYRTYPVPILHGSFQHLDLPIRILLKHVFHFLLLVCFKVGMLPEDLFVESGGCLVCRSYGFLQL